MIAHQRMQPPIWTRVVGDPRWDWIRLAIPAPFLLFPTLSLPLTLATPALWFALGLADRIARGPTTAPTNPARWPLALIACGAIIGTAVTPYPDLTLPKATGLLLGLMVFHTARRTTARGAGAWPSTAVYIGLAALLILPSALAAAWASKLPWFGAIAPRLPTLVRGLPGMAPEGLSPNAVAAATLFLVPFAAVTLYTARGQSAAPTPATPQTSTHRRGATSTQAAARRADDPTAPVATSPRTAAFSRFVTCALAAVLLIGLTLLLLSQSRMGLLSLVVTAALVAAVRWRTARAATGLLAAGFILAALLAPAQSWRLVERAFQDPTTGTTSISLTGRVALWERALEATRDFPWTGVGLGAFRRVLFDMYAVPGFSPDVDVAHCHNTFLQTAVDTGLPGLIGYLALLMCAAVAVQQMRRSGTRDTRALAAGLGSALIAVHLFGLGDAIALGSKIGLLVWLNLGILFGLHGVVATPQRRRASIPDTVGGSQTIGACAEDARS